MGCDSSKETGSPASKKGSATASKTDEKSPSKSGKGSKTSSINGEPKRSNSRSGVTDAAGMRNPVCHFCSKRIPEKDYNAHTVMCDQREVTCWNSWCRQIVKQGDLQKHLEECGKKQKALCPKCGQEIFAVDMQAHRDTCNPTACPNCGEICITRIHKWCPKVILSRLTLRNGPFATEALKQRYLSGAKATDPIAVASYNVARMQLLWRWLKCKALIEESIFRSVYKEMDLKKEGFAIFKAHDKVNDSHVLAPKRSRSVLSAPVVAPGTSSHYFPVAANTTITIEHVERMIKDIRNNVLLPYQAAWRVLTDAMNHLNTMPNIVRISPPVGARVVNGRINQGCKLVVVGDLHGQIHDLLHILSECGMPSESNYYVFNGDFVDRGACGVEVLLVLFSLMLACPRSVTLNRGNHECDYMNDEYGFDVEVSTKYDRNVFRLIQRCFCALPLGTVIGNKIFVVHGGLPRRKGVLLSDISRIQRFRQIPMPNYTQPEEDEIFQDLLWSDPVEDINHWRDSQRGAGVEFGAEVTKEFLKNNKLELVIRSHEECLSGYEEHHGGKLITVFSASNYDGPDTNYGAVCQFIGDNAEPAYHTYQIFEGEEYDEPQMVNLMDSFAFTTPTAQRAASFGDTKSGTNTPMRYRLTHRRSKDQIMRELRERIYQRRHRLMAYFSKLDRTNKGSLWLIEWVESMRNVLNLDLPWYFLRSYLVEVDDKSRIWYAPFLRHYHNLIQPLWIEEWKQSASARLLQQQRANHRSQMVSAAFSKEIVSYGEFCSVMRAIDYTMSDPQLFEMFEQFDTNGSGHISGPDFVRRVQQMANAKPGAMRWDFDALEQLQNIVIQARTLLPSMFHVTSRDRTLTKERYLQGMLQLGRGMRKQMTQAQKERIYEFLIQSTPTGEDPIFDSFLVAFYIFDSRTEAPAHAGSTRFSQSEMVEMGLQPVFMKNTSFSSTTQ